jgi:hypothetical protein
LIGLAQDKNRWRAVGKMAMNIRICLQELLAYQKEFCSLELEVSLTPPRECRCLLRLSCVIAAMK